MRDIYIIALVIMVPLVMWSQDSDMEQDIAEDISFVDFYLDINRPLQEFKKSIAETYIGFSFSYMVQRRVEQYSFFGIQLSYAHYGALSNTVSTQGFEDFNDNTGSNSLGLQFLYRYYTPFFYKTIEPFIEIGLGPQVFYTQTTTTFFDENNSSEVNFEEADLGLLYSVSLGSNIKIYEMVFGIIKFSYQGGSAMSYLVPQDMLSSEIPIDSFDATQSSTQHFSFQLGIAISI